MLLACADFNAALTAWATLGAVVIALGSGIIALCALRSQIKAMRDQLQTSNSIRTTELVTKTYTAFVDTDEMLIFYARIRKNDPEDPIDWEHTPQDERLLNKCLTLFDGCPPRWRF